MLTCLERNGIKHAASCRSGICQSCMMKVTTGAVPSKAQQGLKGAYRAQGYFLACVCEPAEDIAIDDCGAVGSYPARISAVTPCGERVIDVRVEVSANATEPFTFEAGQFISLVRADGLTRPYSIANLPGEGVLELHVAVREHGRMSEWLSSAVGHEVTVRGPSGECYYQATSPDQPLLLAATGTGLAPLLGVLRTAIHRGHRGPIYIYHASRTPVGLYKMKELRALAAEHNNVHVVGAVLESGGEADVREQSLQDAVLGDHGKLQGVRIYLCGNPTLVRTLKKKAFLAGANLQEIHSDPFVTAPQNA